MKWWPWSRDSERAEQGEHEADKVLREVMENRPRVDKAASVIRRELRENNFSRRLNDIFKS